MKGILPIAIFILVLIAVIYYLSNGEGYLVGGLLIADEQNVKDKVTGDIFRLDNGLLRKFSCKEIWDAQPNKVINKVTEVGNYPRGLDITPDNVAGLLLNGLIVKDKASGQLYVIIKHSWGWHKKWRISPMTYAKYGPRPYVAVETGVIAGIPGNAYWVHAF